MKVPVGAFNQEKTLVLLVVVEAFPMITNLREDLRLQLYLTPGCEAS